MHEWQQAGVWQRINSAYGGLLARLRETDKVDLVADGGGFRVRPGGFLGGRTSTPTRQPAGRMGRSTARQIRWVYGIPLAATLTGANRNDITQLIPLVDAIPPIPGQVGGPPSAVGGERVYADRGYDSQPRRRSPSRKGHSRFGEVPRLWARGIQPRLARPAQPGSRDQPAKVVRRAGWVGGVSLGGRTNTDLTASIPTPPDSLGTPRRYS